MAKVEVVMPQLGESLTEGTIVKWNKKPGDKVQKDETLLEISTDKVDSEIPSPATGVVTRLFFEEQKTVAVRTVIAEIETDASVAVISESGPPPGIPEAKEKAKESPKRQPEPVVKEFKKATEGRFYSPLVLNIAGEEGIPMAELDGLPGSGQGGRVTKKDILAYVATRKAGKFSGVSASPQSGVAHVESTLKHVEEGELAKKYPAPDYEILQMSNIISRMSDHMVRSVHTSPHVWAVHECDMTNVDAARKKNAEMFNRREGFKLTYTPFVCDAVIRAIKQYPLINSSVEGDKIILKKFVNLAIAVATEGGLIVPVIKNADEKNFVGLARTINDLANRARMKRLTPTDIEGGTFTITNFGVFNTYTGIPIINQPQVAILGTGAIKKRPVVINDAIAVRSIANITLAFDHRIIDGALGGSFVETVCKLLENYDPEIVL